MPGYLPANIIAEVAIPVGEAAISVSAFVNITQICFGQRHNNKLSIILLSLLSENPTSSGRSRFNPFSLNGLFFRLLVSSMV